MRHGLPLAAPQHESERSWASTRCRSYAEGSRFPAESPAITKSSFDTRQRLMVVPRIVDLARIVRGVCKVMSAVGTQKKPPIDFETTSRWRFLL